jgi:hypothetical protein
VDDAGPSPSPHDASFVDQIDRGTGTPPHDATFADDNRNASATDASATDAGAATRACVPIGSYVPPPGTALDGSGFRLSDGQRTGHGLSDFNQLAIGDVTGDGRLDVVAIESSTGGWVFAQTGGAWNIIGPLDVNLDRFAWSGPVVLDVDGDHIDDILVSTPKGLFFIRSLGDGQFADAVPLGGPQMAVFRAYDEDGDGRTDLMGLSDASPMASLVIYRGNAGSFDPPRIVSLASAGPAIYPTGFAFGNLTGTGRRDLVVTFGAAVVLYTRQPDGSYVLRGSPYPLTAQAIEEGIDVGDLDGDGKDDVVVSEDATDALDHIWGLYGGANGLGQPTSLYLYPAISDEVSGGAVSIVDINLDGRLDIVNVDQEFNVRLLLGSDGGFRPVQSFTIPTYASVLERALAVGDLNCDGCPDVVTADVGGLVFFPGFGCRSNARSP